MSDRELDFSAFAAREWPGLVRLALVLTGDRDAAEDLAQIALARTHQRWRFIVRRDRPELYSRQIMVNVRRSWWRRERGRERLVADVPDGVDQRAPDPAAITERDAVLGQALAGLPARMRATLVLRFYEDLSEHQVAAVLGCSVGTVKSQTSRGLDRLRQALGDGATAGSSTTSLPNVRRM